MALALSVFPDDPRFNKKAVKQRKVPLASMLTLHPYYFPEELFTDKDKR
jgi:hypothetical protein